MSAKARQKVAETVDVVFSIAVRSQITDNICILRFGTTNKNHCFEFISCYLL